MNPEPTTETMAVSERQLGWLALVTAVLTTLWLGLLFYSTYLTGFADTFDQAVENAVAHGWVFYAGYANAALITVVAMMLFAGFYVYCRSVALVWAVIGLVFVPVYGVLNLIVYVSQLTVVPPLLDQYQANGAETTIEPMLAMWMQGWTGSAMWMLNNLAYAILGIPSIVFGALLGRQNPALSRAGWILAASGIASIVGMGGIVDHLHLINVPEVPHRQPQVEQRGAAADEQLTIVRVGDRQRAGAVGEQFDGRAMDTK